MALDLILQCIPAGCLLLDEAETEPMAYEALVHFHSYIQMSDVHLQHAAQSESRLPEFVRRCRNLEAENPGLMNRRLFFGRMFHVMHYLLTNMVPSENHQQIDFALPIFTNSITERPTAFEVSFYVLSVSQVGDVCRLLEAVEVERFADAWNPPAMRAAHIYKAPQTDELEMPIYITEEFEELRAFYKVAQAHDEEVFCTYI